MVRRRSSSKERSVNRCQIGGPHPDAMTHRDPVDGNQGVAVLLDTGDRRRVASPVDVGEAIGGRPSGIEGRGVSDGVEMGHDFRRVVGRELRSDVGQAVEPTPNPDGSLEDRLHRIDHPRGAVGGDCRRGALPSSDHVAEELGPADLGLFVPHRQVEQVLGPLGSVTDETYQRKRQGHPGGGSGLGRRCNGWTCSWTPIPGSGRHLGRGGGPERPGVVFRARGPARRGPAPAAGQPRSENYSFVVTTEAQGPVD